MKAKYINPFTDFGFKKLFGEEGSKELLIDFLNNLLPIRDKIVNLEFEDKEKLPETTSKRKAVYDIFCRDEGGQQFIVEMQNAKQVFFKDRTVFYSTFPIREQAEKGEWDYQLKPVYCVGLLGFEFAQEEEPGYLHVVKLKNQNNNVFYEKLTYVFIELPKFNKNEDELESNFDKWLYFLKNLEDFEQIPEILNEDVFIKAFKKAEIANYDREQLAAYEESLKIYRDNINVINTARKEGLEEGIEKGKKEGIVTTLTVLLEKKLKRELPHEIKHQLQAATREELIKMSDNVFEIESLEDLRKIIER